MRSWWISHISRVGANLEMFEKLRPLHSEQDSVSTVAINHLNWQARWTRFCPSTGLMHESTDLFCRFAGSGRQDIRTTWDPALFPSASLYQIKCIKRYFQQKGARTGSIFLKIWHQHFWFIWSMMVMMNSTLLRIQTLFSSQPFEKNHLCRFSVSSVSSRRRSHDRKCCLTKFLAGVVFIL